MVHKHFVLSFDVADGSSVAGLFKDHGDVLIPPFTILHSKSSFIALEKLVLSFSDRDSVIVLMESTSIYHYPVERFFRSRGFEVLVLNPLIPKHFSSSLRKTKTDPLDCAHIAETYFHMDIMNFNLSHDDIFAHINAYHRQYVSLEETLVSYKNRFLQLISLTFPEYRLCFKNKSIYSHSALSLIQKFPHPELILHKRVDTIASVLSGKHKKTLHHRKVAEHLKELSKDSFPGVPVDSPYCFSLSQLAGLILDLQEEMEAVKSAMISLAKKTELFTYFVSVFGIGELTATQLIAELRDICRFDNVKQLTAFCGLDPAIDKSGKTIDRKKKISKRGNKYARKVLFLVCMGIIKASSRGAKDHPIFVYYQKKKKEGKHFYECLVACSTKLLRILFALVKGKKTFQYVNT